MHMRSYEEEIKIKGKIEVIKNLIKQGVSFEIIKEAANMPEDFLAKVIKECKED